MRIHYIFHADNPAATYVAEWSDSLLRGRITRYSANGAEPLGLYAVDINPVSVITEYDNRAVLVFYSEQFPRA